MSASTPSIYIRVDGNDTIATGHVMRCLSVAAQLRNLGLSAIFLTADDNPSELIHSREFPSIILNTLWNDLDSEADVICEFLEVQHAKVLLLDSYQVTEKYLSRLSQVVNVIYIDDLYAFPYPVHSLINYSVWTDRNRYLQMYTTAVPNLLYTTAVPNLLLGGGYIPLREEFAYTPRTIQPEISNILLTMGGTDSYNVMGKLLRMAAHIPEFDGLQFHAIIGIFHQHKEDLLSLADTCPNIHLHENVRNMSYYMRLCDIAVSAGGSTLYELCACGTPTICLEIADNQSGSEVWEAHDYMLYAGNIALDEKKCLETCLAHILTYSMDYELRKRHSIRCQSLVDGDGAKRIAEYIRQSSL